MTGCTTVNANNQTTIPQDSLLGPPASSRHTPWYSRGYLPHLDHPGLVQSITFRLADSLPQSILAEWAVELAGRPDPQDEREKRMAKWLDAGHGSCLLADPRAAQVVEDALLHFDGDRYRIAAWCVMPNHVHVLIETIPGQPLSRVIHSWKSFTANEINRLLGRSGLLWMREYHDRFIRDDEHLAAAIRYIEANPVKAGLVTQARDWRFSSAWMGRLEAGGPSIMVQPKGGA